MVKICKMCGKPYDNGNRKYCSDECQRKAMSIAVAKYQRKYRAAEKEKLKRENAIPTGRRTKYIPPSIPCDSKGISYETLTAEEKTLYGRTQTKAYANDFKVTIPQGLKSWKERQNEKTATL